MQESSSPMLQLDQSDCLLMELTSILSQTDLADPKEIDLYLTLRFKEAWEPLLGGRFRFGVKSGLFKLKLENCMICTDPTQANLIEHYSESKSAIACHGTLGGTQTEPYWLLSFPQPVVSGLIPNFPLGKIHVTNIPCQVIARLEILPADIQLTEVEGVWRHDISPNKHAILATKLDISLKKLQLKTHLTSSVVLQYNSLLESPAVKTDQSQMSATIPAELENLIHQVLDANTDKFVELAKIAQLDPQSDFVGANLLGVNLIGADLGGFNFEQAILRGADLSDADLSDVNLQGAYLGGADASGALLSDANLSGADLHRCSLALANLSGANLRNANLRETNLSNANLSDADLSGANLSNADLHQAGLGLTNLTGTNLHGAKVNQARFRHDSGLSVAIIQDLKQRGAIFIDG